MNALTSIIIVAVMLGLLASVGLTVPAAAGAVTRVSWLYWTMVAVMGAGLLAIWGLAAGDDSSHGTRWDFVVERGGKGLFIGGVAAGVIALAVLGTAIVRGTPSHWRRPAMGVAVLGFIGILTAWVTLMVGR